MTKTEIYDLKTVASFIEWHFNIFPGEKALPAYWKLTNRAEQTRKLATVRASIVASQLSDYALEACAKGYSPWRYEFLRTIPADMFVDSYPIKPEDVPYLEHIAEQRLIAAIEQGAADWALEHAKSE